MRGRVIPPISTLEYFIYLFMISPWPIGRQTVGKQMELDRVVMDRPALNMASMNFFYRYEGKIQEF